MRVAALIGLALAGCNACHASQLPPAAVWQELVDWKCAAPDPNGPARMAAELDAGTNPMFSCLAAGGTKESCHVPCGASGQ